jgi:uncharacterized membrane protein
MRRLAAGLAAQQALAQTRAGRALVMALLLLGAGTVVALVSLWPHGDVGLRSAQGIIVASQDVIPARVQSVRAAICPGESKPGCERVGFRLEGGLHRGRSSYLMLPGDEATPRVSPGDRIRVTPNAESFGNVSAEAVAGADPSQAPYGFVDFERRRSLLWLAIAFAVLVVTLGRWVGAVSLVGAGAGLFLVTAFMAPAILAGSPPFVVALVGSFAAMFLAIVPLYGLGAKSLAALLGTAVSLLVIAAAAVLAVHATHITGTASEDATLVQSLGGGRLSLQGLVIAGMLIGALGVLNDVTVSQSSTVLALRRANPRLHARELVRTGLEVGRDHLGATVNTLVFAYAGAALPLLLIFSSQDLTFGDAINRETVAAEIVAALVGSLGLICAVPLTTVTAALLAVRLPDEALIGETHTHTH